MMRIVLSFIFFLFLTVIEFSFISSLPNPFLYLPLLLAVSIYSIQHLDLDEGVWWMIGIGFMTQFAGQQIVPFEIILYSGLAALCYFLSKQIFSNRSLFGIIGCATIVYATLTAVRSLFFFFSTLNDTSPVFWDVVSKAFLSQYILLILTVWFIFLFGDKLRAISEKYIFISR